MTLNWHKKVLAPQGIGSFFRWSQTCFFNSSQLRPDINKQFFASDSEFQGAVTRRVRFSNFNLDTGKKTGFSKLP